MSEANVLKTADPEVWSAIDNERRRQQQGLEMIASENYTSPAVLAAQGSVLTNKYAEGYPGRRYYGGCEFVDVVERLAIDRALQLFGAEKANVQPHSGAQANMAVYFACLEPGDTILAMDLSHGGHLTHGMRLNFSGKLYRVVSYGVRRDDERIDFDQVAQLAREHRPKLVVAGASAYPREIDFGEFATICQENKTLLMVDMAHIAGLVAAELHADPVPAADFVTSTTHKTLRGPRAGFILCKKDWAAKVNSAVFPGMQGGPLMHAVAAKAIAFRRGAQTGIPSLRRSNHRQCANPGPRVGAAGVPACLGRHRQSLAACRCCHPGSDRQDRRTSPRCCQHHGQQEHDSLRQTAAPGSFRHPNRHPRPDDSRHARTGDAEHRQVDRRSARRPGQ